MMKPNEFSAYLTLVGDFDPNEISVRLGLQPTRSWRKGEINPRTQYERNHSRWSLASRVDQAVCLEKQVSDVLEQIRPHSEAVANIRATIDGGLQLVAYLHTSYPGFALENEVLAELGRMKLGIDCDFYYLYSDKREDSN